MIEQGVLWGMAVAVGGLLYSAGRLAERLSNTTRELGELEARHRREIGELRGAIGQFIAGRRKINLWGTPEGDPPDEPRKTE